MLGMREQIISCLKEWKRRGMVICDFFKLRNTRHPPEIWIENTNSCNASCVMCPRDKHIRPLGFMKLELFTKLIDEIVTFPRPVQRLHLHNYGEPLLDQELTRRIRYAKERGIKHLYFVSNGSLLNSELSRELIEAGLDELKISFYGTDRQSYNSTMRGLDFDKTLDNIQNFIRIREQLNSNTPKMIIQYLPQDSNQAKTDEFMRIFNGIVRKSRGDSLNIFSLHNFGAGKNYRPLGKKILSICNYPWRTLVILQNGKAVICCLDFNGLQIVGDATRESIFDIWNGAAMKKIKSDFKNLAYDGYPVCSRCERVR